MARDLADTAGARLKARFEAVRARSVALAAPFSPEDLAAQAMADASPGKWHLAHPTWFWETFLLKAFDGGHTPFDPRFNYLFNSYYEAIGPRQARPERGLITRPGLDAVLAYRAHVDTAVRRWFDEADAGALEAARGVIETGLAHEEQHQELFLTDMKYLLSRAAWREAGFAAALKPDAAGPAPALEWIAFEGGVFRFGHEGGGFAFDNEGPAHNAVLTPFALASRPVTNGEFLAFIEDGGYRQARHWLSDGWALIRSQGRAAPLYWTKGEAGWSEFTLHGEQPLDLQAPVSHVDYFEASAYAAWTGARLPEEREWEHAARGIDPDEGRWADAAGWLHPAPPPARTGLAGLFGEVWEWTRSAYAPYPGYRADDGAIGEYNAKFMCGQFVLRGGSALTSPGHVRATYRNFFPPGAQWQMTGLRLARDL